MAAAATSPTQTAFDIRTLAAFPMRLGLSAQQPPSGDRYTGVQYNHKPTISDPKRSSTSIKEPESGSKVHTLRLKEGGDEYTYKGTQSDGQYTYVLLPDSDGDGYILERLDTSYNFNLARAPWEHNSRLLAQRYPQLSSADQDEAEEGELFGGGPHGDADQDAEADQDNPFDFRHYTHATADSPSPQSHPTKHTTTGTPSSIASQASAPTSTPLARSVRKQPPSAFALQEKKLKAKPKPKPAAIERPPQSKRVRLSPEAERKQPNADIPTVRLDRRASTRPTLPTKKRQQHESRARNDTDNPSLSLDDTNDTTNNDNHNDDEDDDGDLILEGDTPATRYQGPRSLGAALSGTLGAGRGPRSLLSAASSPASYMNSPRQLSSTHNVDTDGEDIEIDMGPEDVASPDDEGSLVLEGDGDNDDLDENERHAGSEEDDADADADEDVEEIHLPSPAQVHRPSVSGTVVTADDDDDLENDLLMALEGGDDDVSGVAQQESEEESEEE